LVSTYIPEIFHPNPIVPATPQVT